MPMGLLIIIITAVVRFWLVVNLPIQFLPLDVPKGAAFIRLAADATTGLELESFNQFTFTGPGYPLFLVLTNFSGLPLSVMHAFFQTVAIAAVALIEFRLTRSRWAAAPTFIALAFCPVGLSFHRVLPDQIYWAQTLLAFSLFATMIFAPLRGLLAAVLAALAGLILGWTFHTSEAGSWLLIAFVLVSFGGIWPVRHRKQELLYLTRNFCVAAVGFVAISLAFLTVPAVDVDVDQRNSRLPPQVSFPRAFFTIVESIFYPDLASCFVSVESVDFRSYWRFLNYPRVRSVPPNGEVTTLGWYYDSQSIEWPAFRGYTQEGQESSSIANT